MCRQYSSAQRTALLVETFRSSFTGELTRHGIDGLIKALADRKRQLQTDKS